ncbi:response regulator [Cesiribacter sp. SM1]|uniref:response regulator n=1 Tax=Cesiribacter sp. SM1 TaxID=2861196 RepID=UPI001CD589F6|nr:response regulator [Cesiribacter sp. SM1]
MKVFVVDDEEVSLFITKRLVVFGGLAAEKDVHTFLSAADALSTLTGCSDEALPGLVLLDLSMPVMDGWHFLDVLATLRPAIREKCRIYILTSSLASSDQHRAAHNSMLSGLIHKPISLESISMLIAAGGAGVDAVEREDLV